MKLLNSFVSAFFHMKEYNRRFSFKEWNEDRKIRCFIKGDKNGNR